jgi:TolB-like protein
MIRPLHILTLAMAVALTGCSSLSANVPAAPVSEMVAASNNAADAMSKALTVNLPPNTSILVGTVVRVDDLSKSSTFGRMVSEQVAARLAVNGRSVVEVKLRDSLYVSKEQGEMLLSREVRDLSKTQKAHAVVVGTYAVAVNEVFVTLKVVHVASNTVIAAHSYSVPRSLTYGLTD